MLDIVEDIGGQTGWGRQGEAPTGGQASQPVDLNIRVSKTLEPKKKYSDIET